MVCGQRLAGVDPLLVCRTLCKYKLQQCREVLVVLGLPLRNKRVPLGPAVVLSQVLWLAGFLKLPANGASAHCGGLLIICFELCTRQSRKPTQSALLHRPVSWCQVMISFKHASVLCSAVASFCACLRQPSVVLKKSRHGLFEPRPLFMVCLESVMTTMADVIYACRHPLGHIADMG